MDIIIYIIIGIFAGFFGGLLGIGGGLVTVPSLLAMFHWLDYPNKYVMQVAIGTSLCAMVITSGSSACAHICQKGVHWKMFRALSPGIILGAIIGALIADWLPSNDLEKIFGVSICFMGVYFLLPLHVNERERMPGFFILSAIGTVIGSISSILGIGGGIITVPILTAMGTPLRNAISTSAATGFLIAFTGGVSFLILGLRQETFTGAIGYLYLPAFFFIAIASSIAAPYGAKLVYILPVPTLRKIFGTVLIIVGITMVYVAL